LGFGVRFGGGGSLLYSARYENEQRSRSRRHHFQSLGDSKMALSPKSISPIKTVVAESVPVAPVYDSNNLEHVLRRLRGLVADLKSLSADLALHSRKHSRTHHSGPFADSVAFDPAESARLASLLFRVGEFVHTTGTVLE
jgi:hypothetical protein